MAGPSARSAEGVHTARAKPMNQIAVRVSRKRKEAREIASFELVRPDGGLLPPFTAGAHIDVHVPGGLVRQYSLCGSPSDLRCYRIAVLREPTGRGGSAAMHDALAEGDLVTIGEPRNLFPLVAAQRTVLLAGGIGITPLLCMAQCLAQADSDFVLHYCTRSPERTAFLEEIAAGSLAPRVIHHFDDGDPAQKLDLAAALGRPTPGTQVYVCGPTGFIDFVVQGAAKLGFGKDQVRLEYFAAGAAIAVDGDHPFEVIVSSTGRHVTVPAGVTVAQALGAAGVHIPVSCEQGICGTCLTGVLEGECDHRDFYLTEEEQARNERFAPCCSRAKSAVLVLDL